MKPPDQDLPYLLDMRQAAAEVSDFISRVSYEAFLEDHLVQRAVERSLEIVGEAARRVSADFRTAQASISWHEINGLRNILAHDYGDIDLEQLWSIATGDIPLLNAQLNDILTDRPNRPSP
jgi:uncharacterized protein with HEPN domain